MKFLKVSNNCHFYHHGYIRKDGVVPPRPHNFDNNLAAASYS